MAVLLRMLLCIEKRLFIDNVELHMHSLAVEIGPDQCFKVIQSLFSGER